MPEAPPIETPPVEPPATPTAATLEMTMPAQGLPDALNMYAGQPLSQVFDGVTSMRSSLTEATANNTKLTTENGVMKTQIETLKAGQIDPETAPLAPEITQQAIEHYHEHGAVDPDYIENAFTKGVLIPKQEMLDYFEWKKDQRETQFADSQNWLKENNFEKVDYRQLHAFLRDTKTNGFDIGQLQAFDQMTKMGDLSWIKHAMGKFNEALGRGYMPQQFNAPQVAPGQIERGGGIHGRPTGAPAPDAFSNHGEYLTALAEAQGDHTKETAVAAKLAKSDTDSWPDLPTG